MLVLAAGIGYALGSEGHEPTHGLERSSMARMMMSGSLQQDMSDHMQLLDDMRQQMTPEMRTTLDEDEMWQMMQSGDLEAMMDELGHMMGQMPGMDRHGHREGR